MNKKEKRLSWKSLYSETFEGGYVNISCGISNTGNIGIYTRLRPPNKSQPLKSLYDFVTEGTMISIICVINKKTDYISFRTQFSKSSNDGYKNNKSCGDYLGIHISERILSHIYPNVQRMPHNNQGYDFICGKGFRVDVKSSCLRTQWQGNWVFHIGKNKIADYFLCLAFDDRKHLNPQHVWLIPGNVINNLTGASIAISTLDKWKQYEQPLNEIITCCDSIR